MKVAESYPELTIISQTLTPDLIGSRTSLEADKV